MTVLGGLLGGTLGRNRIFQNKGELIGAGGVVRKKSSTPAKKQNTPFSNTVEEGGIF